MQCRRRGAAVPLLHMCDPMTNVSPAPLGAFLRADGVFFRAWAPAAAQVSVVAPSGERMPLVAAGDGLFEGSWRGARPGFRYQLVLDDRQVPDPYARFLPDGVHGFAEVVDETFAWSAPQRPIQLARCPALYELHVGTFTDVGTFAAAQAHLDHLVELGVGAIELMPVAAFAGQRGWGYDGVVLRAPHAAYGRPDDLKRFVDAAHARGLSVILDVVLNHFGPDGNYLGAFSPDYFDPGTPTPWGPSPAFAHPRMRDLLLGTVRHWLEDYRFDGLRLDATHTIGDRSLLTDAARLARSLPEPRLLIAEDERNDPTLIVDTGLDALWADDLHHLVHVLCTGEDEGYYADYPRDPQAVARALARGWYYEGQASPATGKTRGHPPEGLRPWELVTCLENHDQVGNRARGERFGHLVAPEVLRGATLAWLMGTTTPLLFMGQEWGASTPFQFFTDHVPALGEQVIEGRRREFARFAAFADQEARDRIPNPQDVETYRRSTLDWSERDRPGHRELLELHGRALQLRRHDPVLSRPDLGTHAVEEAAGLVTIVRTRDGQQRRVLWNTTDEPMTLAPEAEILLASTAIEPGLLPPHAAVVLAT